MSSAPPLEEEPEQSEEVEVDSTPDTAPAQTQPQPETSEAVLPLPAGWEETADFSGRTVYVNHLTRTAQFERPRPESRFVCS